MRSTLLFLLASGLATICAAQDLPGRYQLLAAEVMNAAGTKREPRLFRIDTITGQTCVLDQGPVQIGEGASRRVVIIQGWTAIPDSFIQSVMEVQSGAQPGGGPQSIPPLLTPDSAARQ